jgi:hypothetical protein
MSGNAAVGGFARESAPPFPMRLSAAARIGESTLLLCATGTDKREHDKLVLGPPACPSSGWVDSVSRCGPNVAE